ncbi:MAG: GNAT family N-acetyltransferase [Candidatus Thermoplasmatota archaeon]|nr:GNAT family N-acetyltransferase [Candidatus Thermoplasmatota archaeon]MBU4071457.1 GNAT family N-acetyltransferase [Candidatus Thermoplasmatota archaeon]MBU4144439.1 GNAT family N-acetyltransferase [Candidatus Thermoplasmatota archaeon]MBU4592329.1 GNAT family N-acetyltransferase [Candidatus Thermoplasmatota archaeon]
MRLLPPAEYGMAAKLLDEVPFNTLFAGTVLEGHMLGSVYADGSNRTFLIVHPYGMSLLLGRTDSHEFNRDLEAYMMNADRRRKRTEWLQIYPLDWVPVIENILGGNLVRKSAEPQVDDPTRVMVLERVNFRFDMDRFPAAHSPPPGMIVRTTAEMFEKIRGQIVPRYFWRDAEHFVSDGAGFSLIMEEKSVSTAFSAFVIGNRLELGIETADGFRGKGYAEHVSRALIEFCVENGYEPVWSCRGDNIGSFSLAVKLGFEPTLRIPHYKLAI